MPPEQTAGGQDVATPDEDATADWLERRRQRIQQRASRARIEEKPTMRARGRGSAAALAKGERAKCSICYRITNLLRKGIFEYSQLDLDLEEMLSLPCQKHRALLLSMISSGDAIDTREAVTGKVFAWTVGSKAVEFMVPFQYSSGPWTIRALSSTSKHHACTGRRVTSRWIQPSLARRWITRCNRLHGSDCSETRLQNAFTEFWPKWLIDTWGQCIVPGTRNMRYAALSYVWGPFPIYTTKKINLEGHQKWGALSGLPIALTIRDSLELTEKLGERYCWVDALCIVQDDEKSKYAEIENMSAIFANASFTIVAEGPEDAHQGLAGVSRCRDFGQTVFKLKGGIEITRDRVYGDSPNILNTRAWTFQERLFSRRLLILDHASIRWECQAAQWVEDVLPKDGAETGLATYRRRRKLRESVYLDMPDSSTLLDLVADYNTRSLTFPSDALFAFMGTMTALQRCYKGSFLSGLPLLFFDIALLWQPKSNVVRRAAKAEVTPSTGLPSWSWSGWQCDIERGTWDHFMVYDKSCRIWSSNTTPTVKWFYHHEVDGLKVEIDADWYDYKKHYYDTDEEAPSGWTKHEIFETSRFCTDWPDRSLGKELPKYFYRHERSPDSEFWYPIPLPEESDTVSPSLVSFISCRTRRSWLTALRLEPGYTDLADRDGNIVGSVQCFQTEATVASAGADEHTESQLVEIVELSKGYVAGIILGTLVHHFYNVMWIERNESFACRKGLGTVALEEWEKLDLEYIDLTLG